MTNKFNNVYNKIISEMNEDIMKAVGFSKEVEDVKNGVCPFCNNAVNLDDFTSNIELKEYKISGLCKKCQDKIFNNSEEDYDDQDDSENSQNIENFEDIEDDKDIEDDEYSDAIPEEPEDFRNDEVINNK